MKRALALTLVLLAAPSSAQAAVDLSSYTRVGRYDIPVPEASAVTYDADTDTLFAVGDGGTAITQLSKTGQLIDTMTLPAGSSPQGTEFYDTEGLAYVGGGRFVLVEERYRQVNRFTYVPNTTLTRAAVQTVKLGTTVGNVGIEGAANDPQTGGLIAVKETQPEGIFQTGVDFAAGTATNGSPTTENSTNLFDPVLAGLSDFSDVYALADGTLLIISQEAGKVINVSRSGQVLSTLAIAGDAGNPLSVADQGNEGVTMDGAGRVYIVNEQGGGADKPQLWVYAPGSAPAPSVTLSNVVSTIAENASTASRVKLANVTVVGDTPDTLTVTGPDASAFEVDATGLYLKAGTVLNRTTKPSYTVSVTSPHATSAPLTLTVTAAPSPVSLAITEVSPWSSGIAPYAADWFEVTNTGAGAVNLTGFRVDDSSNAFATAIALMGVPSIAPGQSVIFLEGDATKTEQFKTAWFGSAVPAGFAIGYYSGSGIGLSTDGDAVNLFDASGTRITGVTFGTSTNNFTFDNAAGLVGAITKLSVAGVNGAFTAGGATGSPGRIASPHAEVTAPGSIQGSVPAQLALTLGAPAIFGPFTAGVTRDYVADTTATVVSTAGDATLSATAPGHLANGSFALAQPVQMRANAGAYAPLSTTPATLLSYSGPVSNDRVTLGVKQTIGETDPLRTGAYALTVTLTLATSTP